jgi:hypothetical protein
MKNAIKIIFVALIMSVTLFAGKYMTAISVRAASIQSIKGTVEVQRAHTTAWIPATEGMKLNEGDVVRTKSKSKVVIQLDDGSVTQLTSLSSMTMDKLSRSLKGKSTDMNMEVGKSWMKVKKLNPERDKFNVSTPTAVAGVRGTYFSSEVEETTDSSFDVFEGEIAVSQRSDPTSQVPVRTNHRTEVKRGNGPTAAQEIPANELQQLLTDGIEGGLQNENAAYDLNIKIDPPKISAGGRANVIIQFMESGKPYNGAVTFTLTLGGSATFVQNGQQTLDVSSNEKGMATVEITSTKPEEISVNADVQFEEQK